MHDDAVFADGGYIEAYGALVAVEVIVKSRCLGNEKRRAYALEVKRLGKLFLEGFLYKCYCLLSFIYVKRGFLIPRHEYFIHIFPFVM